MIVAILGQSLSILGKGGYQLSPTLIILLIFQLRQLNKISIVYTLPILAYTLIIALTQFAYIDLFEFQKSFIYLTLFFIVFFNSQQLNLHFGKSDLMKVLKYSIILIVGFEFIQVLELLTLGTSNALFFLDDLSISTAENEGRFESVNFLGYTRPISFFHEPSYLGSTLLILLISYDLIEKKQKKIFSIIAIIGIILSLSATSYVFLILYFFVKKDSSSFSKSIKVISIIIALLFSAAVISFLRLDELLLVGSSGWNRIILPYLSLKSEIIEYYAYFGRTLGNTSIIYDNSFFLVLAYFGALTPVLLFYLIKQSERRIIQTRSMLIGILTLLFLNGAIFTPESSFLLMILIICIKINIESNTETNLISYQSILSNLDTEK